MAERDGYELRNQLIDLLGSDGRDGGQGLSPDAHAQPDRTGVALQNDATITRYNDTLTATYVLTDAKGTEVTRGTQTSLSSYNVVQLALCDPGGAAGFRPPRRRRYRRAHPHSIWASSSAGAGDDRQDPARPTVSPPIRPRRLRVALVFGPDAGLVQERAEKLLKSVVADLTDPFNVADLSEAVLAVRSGAAGRRGRRDLHDGRPPRGAGARRRQRSRRSVRGIPGSDHARRRAGGGGRRAISPKARACASCSKATTRPPPSPAMPTPPAIWKMWCAMPCAPKGFPSRPTRWPMRCRGWARTAA